MWADRSNVSLFSDGFGFNSLQTKDTKIQIIEFRFCNNCLHVAGGNIQMCCCRFEHGGVTFEHSFVVTLQLNFNLLVQFVRNSLGYWRTRHLTFSVKQTPAQQSALASRASRGYFLKSRNNNKLHTTLNAKQRL